MKLATVWYALSWRWRIARRKRYLRRQFRNAEELIGSYLSKSPCQAAVCRDGTVIRHPDRAGLAQTILELWYDRVYTHHFYDPKPGDMIVDAGANVGLFSIWISRACPGCRVLAFEPFAENYRFLEANLAEGQATRVRAVPFGLSSASGLASMRDGVERSLDHRLEIATSAAAGGQEVRTVSLAEVVGMAGEKIALFKCDIEGSEYDLFEHAGDEDLRSVSRYAIEYHDNLRPGTSELVRSRLNPTHEVVIQPDGVRGYGMLYAVERRPA